MTESLRWEDLPQSLRLLIGEARFRQRLISAESDRVSAILVGAYLDSVLEELLRAHLTESDSTTKLFRQDGPLASLSSRIDLFAALGFIPQNCVKDLHYFPKIRNEFAHKLQIEFFETAPVRDWCAELSGAEAMDASFWEPLRPNLAGHMFSIGLVDVTSHLINAARQISPVTPLDFVTGLADLSERLKKDAEQY